MQEEAMLNLRWNLFSSELATTLDTCYEKQYFVDLSLVCKDGTVIKCHKMVLANSSSFFRRLLVKNDHPHPMILLHDIEADDLKTIVNFMYCGEIEVVKSEVRRLLKIAEILEISGLKDIRASSQFEKTVSDSPIPVIPNVEKIVEQKNQPDYSKIFPKPTYNFRKRNLSTTEIPAESSSISPKQENNKKTGGSENFSRTEKNNYERSKPSTSRIEKNRETDEQISQKHSTDDNNCQYLKKLRLLDEIEIICQPNDSFEQEVFPSGIQNIDQMTPLSQEQIANSPYSNSNSNSGIFIKDELDIPFDDYDTRYSSARRAVRKKLFATPGIEIFKSPPKNSGRQSMPSTSRAGSISPGSTSHSDTL